MGEFRARVEKSDNHGEHGGHGERMKAKDVFFGCWQSEHGLIIET